MNRGFEAAVGPALHEIAQIHHQGTRQGVHIHPNLRKKHGKMVGTLSNKNVKWWEHGEKWRKWRNIGGTWSKNCGKWWDNAGNMEQTWWKIYNGKLWNTVKNDGIGLNGKIGGLSPSSKNMEFLIWQEWNLISLRWFKYSVQNESLSTFEHQACLPIWKISAEVYESLRVSAGRLPSKSLAA